MNARDIRRVLNRANQSQGGPAAVEIVYLKKGTGNVVRRTIRPYEFVSGSLFATDVRHAGDQPRQFLTRNIQSVTPASQGFRPRFAVRTPFSGAAAKRGRGIC